MSKQGRKARSISWLADALAWVQVQPRALLHLITHTLLCQARKQKPWKTNYKTRNPSIRSSMHPVKGFGQSLHFTSQIKLMFISLLHIRFRLLGCLLPLFTLKTKISWLLHKRSNQVFIFTFHQPPSLLLIYIYTTSSLGVTSDWRFLPGLLC